MTLFSLSIATAAEGKEVVNPVGAVVAEDKEGKDQSKGVGAEDIEIQTVPGGEEKKGTDVAVFPVTCATLLFQVVLMLVCCHYSMVLTNWGDPVVNSDMSNFFAENWASFWIKICMQWLSFLLYLVSQIMGRMCPERFE